MRMKRPSPNRPLAATAWLLAVLCASPAFAAGTVQLTEDTAPAGGQAKTKEDDSQAWHRKLWTGSFDTAADASGAAAKQLDGLEFGDCNDYLKPVDGKQPTSNLYWACMQRKQASANYANEARSIQKQQKVMSVISKASDLAAVGAVGAVAYAELGVKKNNQADTYASAANIQKTAGEVAYVTGAADFSMGAYAYIAQKNKLDQMKNTITGSVNGVKADTDPAVSGALTTAVEAAKKAAYAHMMWGAGKLAAGYGMMYVAKKSQDQAARMGEIQADKDMIAALQAQQATGGTSVAANAAIAGGGGPAPYYQNNAPAFTIPTSSGGASTASPAVVNYGSGGSTTGGSAPLLGAAAASARNLASTGGVSGGGGAAASGGDPKADAATGDAAKDKTAKEALSGNFEMQLSGGMKGYAGTGSSGGGKDDVPNIASLMGNMGDQNAKTAATGISPTALYAAGTEGTDGQEQGSMSGVNGKSETSLFAITKAKLTKMFEVGNVGIPKNVEVKN
jgi:hypothetical protein